MDPRKILEKIDSRETKERFTISIDGNLLNQFKKLCGERSLSAVMEEMAREFIREATSSTPPSDPVSCLRAIFPALNDSQLRSVLTIGNGMVKENTERNSVGKALKNRKHQG